LHTPSATWLSGTAREFVSQEETALITYWLETPGRPIRPGNCLETIRNSTSSCCILGIGPDAGLISGIRNDLEKKGLKGFMATTLMRDADENISDLNKLLEQVGNLWLKGVDFNWKALHGKEKRRKISAPTYYFERNVLPIGQDVTPLINLNDGTLTLIEEETVGEKDLPVRQTNEPLKENSAEGASKFTGEGKKVFTPTEEILLEIWTEFFEVEEIEIHDNFFEIGGDSLRAMSMLPVLAERIGFEIPLDVLFSLRTISELAAHIDDVKSSEPIEPESTSDDNTNNDRVRITI
jgi:acyl carrier protein